METKFVNKKERGLKRGEGNVEKRELRYKISGTNSL